jgi:galactose mutarotase-like enzyme
MPFMRYAAGKCTTQLFKDARTRLRPTTSRNVSRSLAWTAALAGVSGSLTATAFAHAPPQLVRLSAPGSELTAWIAPTRGGELAGLELDEHGQRVELLFHGREYRDSDAIASRAPILWPAVGRNFPPGEPIPGNDSDDFGWLWHGQRLPMPIHGFARTYPWRLLGRGRQGTTAFVTVGLSDSAATRRNYPFGFHFTVRYVLRGAEIRICQRIEASAGNGEAMPFSIGNHLTFNIPLQTGAALNGVSFSTPALVQVITNSAGQPTGELRTRAPAQQQPLISLPPRTALSLAGFNTAWPWVTIRDAAGISVRVSHHADRLPHGVPVLFNLWGDAAGGFFSVEPWVGKQNSLVSGDGLILLAPGETYHWTITLQVTGSRPPRRAGFPNEK